MLYVAVSRPVVKYLAPHKYVKDHINSNTTPHTVCELPPFSASYPGVLIEARRSLICLEYTVLRGESGDWKGEVNKNANNQTSPQTMKCGPTTVAADWGPQNHKLQKVKLHPIAPFSGWCLECCVCSPGKRNIGCFKYLRVEMIERPHTCCSETGSTGDGIGSVICMLCGPFTFRCPFACHQMDYF